MPADWNAAHTRRCNHNRVCLKPVDFLFFVSRFYTYLKYSVHNYLTDISIHIPCNFKPMAVSRMPLCAPGRAVNESSRVRKGQKKKKVCSLLMSAVTSHSAHFHHLPLSFSFCWQIKIHGLPSHPFSLLCLIVLKIEEITKSNLCTNKNLSESWQCIP